MAPPKRFNGFLTVALYNVFIRQWEPGTSLRCSTQQERERQEQEDGTMTDIAGLIFAVGLILISMVTPKEKPEETGRYHRQSK